MNEKRARRFLARNRWNLAPTKLETMGDSKRKNLLKTAEQAKKVLKTA